MGDCDGNPATAVKVTCPTTPNIAVVVPTLAPHLTPAPAAPSVRTAPAP
jgi:hypothetical protein